MNAPAEALCYRMIRQIHNLAPSLSMDRTRFVPCERRPEMIVHGQTLDRKICGRTYSENALQLLS